MPVHPDPFVHPAPPVYPSHSVHAARLPASAETGGCQGPVRFGDAKGRGRAPWWVLGVALLSWGCAAPAESADLDEAALEGEEAAATEVAPLDPVGRYLAVAVPDPERETALLDSLRSVVRDALDDRHPRARRLEAVEEADRYLRELAAVEDWRPLLVAELLAPLGEGRRVEALLSEVDRATELPQRWGWRIQVEAWEAAGDSVAARRVALAEADRAATPGEAAGPLARAGVLALAARDTTAAREALLSALAAGPGHEGAQVAARALDRIHTGSPAEEAALGRALLASGANQEGRRRIAPLLRDPEGSGLGTREEAELRLALGRALVELRQPAEARTVLAPLAGDATPVEWAAEALFLTGQAALQAGRVGDAEDAFHRLARRAPTSTRAEEGLQLLVERSVAAGRERQDRALLQAYLEVGVGAPAGELMVVQMASRKYLAGAYDEAADTFERYLAGARRAGVRQQAAYWAALARIRLGEESLAQAHLRTAWEDDPLSFYGILAGERLSLPVLDRGLTEGPAPSPALQGELAAALTRLRVHQVVPTPGSFVFELARLERHFFQQGDGAYDLAEALFAGGFPIQGVVLGREIHRREGDWDLRLLRIVFPFPYRDEIVREARARGLDPFFVAGLIRQESMFHATILSSAGAVGLMQLLPGTAQEMARSLGIRYERGLLDDPAYNVRLGTQYLANMLRRYDGRAEDALSAYNAGPGRINQWRQRPEYRDRDVFMEHIPFRETRHYVKVVQQYTRIYTALYGCPGFEPCLGESYPTVVARSPYAGGQPGSSLAR